jgi:hypothetical protein
VAAAIVRIAAISRMAGAIGTTDIWVGVASTITTTTSSLTSKTIRAGRDREGKASKTVGPVAPPVEQQVATRKREEGDITAIIPTIITTMAKKWISHLSKALLKNRQMLKPLTIFHPSTRNKILAVPLPTPRNSKKT